jgi:uncharacterized protein DUF5933/PAP2 superfamily protein
VFIGDASRVHWRVLLNGAWPRIGIAIVGVLLVVLQVTAYRSGFQGPLHSLISDYVATPKSATVPWAALGLAAMGLPKGFRIWAVGAAAALDIVFAAARIAVGGAVTVGNGPLIVLTALLVIACLRWTDAQRASAMTGIGFGFLFIVATKVGDTWLRITAMVRPAVLDDYALLADHALAQPSWLMGQLVAAAGPAVYGVLHWVYIELPLAAMVVAVYQLRHATTAGWPRHHVVHTFLLLGLIGPTIYFLFPVVGPDLAFGTAGKGFQLGSYWPNTLPPMGTSPGTLRFDAVTPRNCMPSMHTAWALAVFIHSRNGPRWLRWGGTFWLVCTLTATLGFGYHYGIDLIAGAVLCMTVESALRKPVHGSAPTRIKLVVGGVALLAALLLCVRFMAEYMARYPWLFGPLVIGTLVMFATTFYTTFMARPGCVPWWRRLPLPVAASVLQRQEDRPEPVFS